MSNPSRFFLRWHLPPLALRSVPLLLSSTLTAQILGPEKAGFLLNAPPRASRVGWGMRPTPCPGPRRGEKL